MKRRHTRQELSDLLGAAANTHELAVRRTSRVSRRHPAAHSPEELFVVWSAARAEANISYDDWCKAPGAEAYLVYRAAEDRADAAEQALARSRSIAA